MRKILLIIVLALIGVTSLQVWMTQDRTTQKKELEQTSQQPQGQIGGTFALTDHDGKLVHDYDFHGHLLLVYFGFTQCPDTCPLTLQMLTKTMELLGDKANQVTPLFITLDPSHDTPAVLKDYLTNFDKRIVGLTGTEDQVKDVENIFKVYAAKKGNNEKDSSAGYTIEHSSYIYIMDKDGKFLAVQPFNAPEAEMARMVARYLSQ